jgi:hypothetical protein
MAQPPLDIRVTAHPERGLVVSVEGTELNTAGMENSAVLWGVVSYIVNRLPDDGHMDDLRIAAAQMTEYFRRIAAPVRTRQRAEIAEGLVECQPPPHDCPICFEPHSDGAQWVTLRNCGHCFHFDCISGWEQLTCPLCRDGYTRNTRHRAV